MVNTVSTATENDKKQELLNMNWAEFSDEDKKDLASSLSIQNIDEYMNAIQSDDTIDAQKKEEILDNLLDVRKVREKMDNEGADAIVEQAKQITEMQTEKEEQKKNQLEQAESLKNELNSEDKADENKDENKETQEEVAEEAKEEMKEEVKEEMKEEAKEEMKEEVKEEMKEEAKEEMKEEVKEEVKEDSVDGQVDSLKAELAGKDQEIGSLKEDVAALKNQLSELSDTNVQVLDELRKARTSKDKQTIARQKEIIRRLQAEKDSIRDRYLGALPKYGGDIKTLDTKWIEFKLAGAQSINGQKVLTGPQLRFRQNLRSRKRINTTVKKLNEIGNNPKKGVQFVLTRTFGYDPLKVSGKIGTGFKNLRKFFKIRDIKAFDEMYNKQKKYFIEDLESKMAANSMSEKDKQVIDSIKKRLDYYQAAYKRQFITA